MIYGIFHNHEKLDVWSEYDDHVKQKMREFIINNKRILDISALQIVEVLDKNGATSLQNIRFIASASEFLGTDGVPFKTKGVTQ